MLDHIGSLNLNHFSCHLASETFCLFLLADGKPYVRFSTFLGFWVSGFGFWVGGGVLGGGGIITNHPPATLLDLVLHLKQCIRCYAA